MFNILDTEAGIKQNAYIPTAEIVKLAGEVGGQFVRMYGDGEGYAGLSLTGFIGSPGYCLQIKSTIPGFKLKKGEGVIFTFEDDSFFTLRFDLAGIGGKERQTFIVIPELKLATLADMPLSHITLINGGAMFQCEFRASIDNIHYQTKEQGQKLLQIVVQRIVGATRGAKPAGEGNASTDMESLAIQAQEALNSLIKFL